MRDLQREAGNAAVARAIAEGSGEVLVVARMLRRPGEWERESPSLTTWALRGRTRRPEAAALDGAVAAYVAASGAPLAEREVLLRAVSQAVADARPNLPDNAATRGALAAVSTAVQSDLALIDAERRTAAQDAARNQLRAWNVPLDGSGDPADLLTLFVGYCRARGLRYATRPTPSANVWADGGGPFACGSFARAFAVLLRNAGFPDATVTMAQPRHFVTRPLDPRTIIDPGMEGNVVALGDRQPRYFFTEHYVTTVGGRSFCPTSGSEVPPGAELVEPLIGGLVRVNENHYNNPAGWNVRRVEALGGVYEVTGPAADLATLTS